MSRVLAVACAALLLLAPCIARAQVGGSGYFRKGDLRFDLHSAIAVPADDGTVAGEGRVYVYLTPKPMDAGAIADAFHPNFAVDEALGEGSTGFVRICITAQGEECGLYVSHDAPGVSFNSFGSGDFQLAPRTPGRVAGRWLQPTPEDFFGEPVAYELRFDVAVTPPRGQPLPAGGGDPGKAYRDWCAAVAKGDFAKLEALASEDDRWRIRPEAGSGRLEVLKGFRDGTPLEPRVLRGRVIGAEATLWVEGVDRDGIERRGRVRMRRDDGQWRYLEADLSSAD